MSFHLLSVCLLETSRVNFHTQGAPTKSTPYLFLLRLNVDKSVLTQTNFNKLEVNGH